MAIMDASPCYAPYDPTLPKPWKGLIDTSGTLYYWNTDTDITQYEKPDTGSQSAVQQVPLHGQMSQIDAASQYQQYSMMQFSQIPPAEQQQYYYLGHGAPQIGSQMEQTLVQQAPLYQGLVQSEGHDFGPQQNAFPAYQPSSLPPQEQQIVLYDESQKLDSGQWCHYNANTDAPPLMASHNPQPCALPTPMKQGRKKYSFKIDINLEKLTSYPWERPLSNWVLAVHLDASVGDYGSAAAYVVRDANGMAIEHGFKQFYGRKDTVEAELNAFDIFSQHERKGKKYLIYSDCEPALTHISRAQKKSSKTQHFLTPLAKKICVQLDSNFWPPVEISWVPRDHNFSADALAYFARITLDERHMTCLPMPPKTADGKRKR